MKALLLALCLALAPISAAAQGCAQCRDNTAATPPQTQAAYRHAIELMIVTAGSLFVGGVLLLRHNR